MEDALLIRRIKQGDEAAFDALVVSITGTSTHFAAAAAVTPTRPQTSRRRCFFVL